MSDTKSTDEESTTKTERGIEAELPETVSQVVEFEADSSTLSVCTSSRGIGITTESSTQFVIDGNKMRPQLPAEAASIDDLAVGESAFVVAGDTIYTLHDNGVPRYEVELDDTIIIVHDAEKDNLVAATADGELVWYDTTGSPRRIASIEVPDVDFEAATIVGGFGWTLILSDNECLCYELNDENTPEVTKISVQDIEIFDVSMVDDALIMATSTGVHAFDVPAFEIAWKDPDTNIEELSLPSRECIFGWNEDSKYRISFIDHVRSDTRPLDHIYATTTHEGYLVRDKEEYGIVWGPGETSVEVAASPIQLRDFTDLEITITNPTYRPQPVSLTVETEGLISKEDAEETGSSGEFEISTTVYGFRTETVHVGGIKLEHVDAKPALTISYKRGDEILTSQLDKAPVKVEVEVVGQVTALKKDKVQVEVTAKNTGELPVEILDPDIPEVENSLPIDREVTWTDEVAYDPASASLHGIAYRANKEHAEEENATVRVQHPETVTDIDASLDTKGETAKVQISNQSTARIVDRLNITSNGSQDPLEADIEIGPADETQVWLPVDIRRLAPTTLSINGKYENIPDEKFKFSDPQELHFHHGFELAGTESTQRGKKYPENTPIVEQLKVQNISSQTLHKLTLSGIDSCTIQRLRPDDKARIVRYLRLPQGHHDVPESDFSIDDDAVTLPEKNLRAIGGNKIEIASKIITDEDRSELFLKIANNYSKPVKLEEIKIDGKTLDYTGNKSVRSGNTEQFAIGSIDISGSLSVVQKEYQLIEVGFTKLNGGEKIWKQSLATVSEPEYIEEAIADVDIETTKLKLRSGLKISINSDAYDLDSTITARITSREIDLRMTKEIDFSKLSSHEPAEIVVKPNTGLKNNVKLRLILEGSSKHGTVDEIYVFKNTKSLKGSKWELIRSNVKSEFFKEPNLSTSINEPQVTPWVVENINRK